MTPSTDSFWATTSGVPPARAIRSTMAESSWGIRPPRACTCSTIAAAAPFRITRPSKSTPLIRVCAVNGTNVAPCGASSVPVPTVRPRIAYCSFASTTMLRPSGVSSASDASCAVSASCRASTPSTGMNSTAWRLPSVIVPVLSSSSTSTSPAASTARPESAITLRLIIRSIPAMPIALRRPPIVVGIRHTKSATSTVIEVGVPRPATPTLNTEYGYSVAQTSRNRIVKPTSRMLSAISFGVFCRRAPSISAIMRSMKPSPGFAVMRISSQSDSTTVLPVTALRSPPDSRITGALSPVTALSSTDAIPSMTSPSAGIASPAWTSTTSPFRNAVDGTVSDGAVRSGRTSRLAEMVRRARRSASACALPRPSASASAKFAKTTVNHSQIATLPMNGAGASPFPPSAWKNRIVVSTLPISTTNITGFRTCCRGSRRRKASRIATRQIIACWCAARCAVSTLMLSVSSLKGGAGGEQQVLDDRAERQHRQEAQRPQDDDHGHQPQHKLHRVGGQCPRARGHDFLRGQGSRDREHRDNLPEPPQPHHDRADVVVERGVAVHPRERAAVVVAHRRKRVENLAEPVRARVRYAGLAGRGRHPKRRSDEHDRRHHQDDDRRHFHLERLDLLAEVLRRAAHHEAGHERRDDHERHHVVHSGAHAAVDDLAEVHHHHRHHAGDRRVRIVHRVDRPVRRGGR